MSQLTMTQSRSRRPPRPRVSWGAAATSAALRADRRRARAVLAAERRHSTYAELSLADVRHRKVAALRPLADGASRAWSSAVAALEAARARSAADRGAEGGPGAAARAHDEPDTGRRVLLLGWLGLPPTVEADGPPSPRPPSPRPPSRALTRRDVIGVGHGTPPAERARAASASPRASTRRSRRPREAAPRP